MINQWMEWGTLFLDKPIIMLFGIIRIEECWPQIWCSLVGLPFQQHTTSLRHGESIYSAYSTKAKLINSWLTSPEQIHQKVQTHSLKSWRYHGYDIVFLWFRQCFTRVVAMGISSPGRHLRWARLGSQADAGPTPNDHVFIKTWLVGGIPYPSEKYESQLGLLFPIYGKIIQMFQTTKQLVSWGLHSITPGTWSSKDRDNFDDKVFQPRSKAARLLICCSNDMVQGGMVSTA